MKKKKIAGIFACALLIITSLTMVASADFKQISKMVNTSSFDDEADVPTWSIGDSWTYDVVYTATFDPYNYFEWSLEDLEFTVTDDTGDSYRVEFTGDVTGDIGHFLFPRTLEEGTIEGYEIIKKSGLEISELIAHVDGTTTLPWIGKTPVTIDVIVTFDPAFTCLSFPLYVGKSWIHPTTSVSIDYTITILGVTESKHHEKFIQERTLLCSGKEIVTVEAGTYEAFKITDSWGLLGIYYNPTVGNIVKVSGNDPARFISLDMELIATSYSPSGAPSKPNQPSGPASGDSGETYSYCTSATDPDGDQVYYWFDWGDNTNSGWLGPYDSGKNVCADHSWDYNGIYEIRVKAKDTNEAESPWSDHLIVRIGEEEDNEDPYVELTKPEENSIYYNNIKIGSLPFMTVIMGHLDIEVDASDSGSGINRVEFYIDGGLKETDTAEPYSCGFDESSGVHTIMVIAYDNAGNSASDSITVWRFF